MAKRQRYVKSNCILCDISKVYTYYTKLSVFEREPELAKLLRFLNLQGLDEYYLKFGGFRPYRGSMYLFELTKKEQNTWNCMRDPANSKRIMDSRQIDMIVIVSKTGYITLNTKSYFRIMRDGCIEVFSATGGKSHTVKVTENLVLNESF